MKISISNVRIGLAGFLVLVTSTLYYLWGRKAGLAEVSEFAAAWVKPERHAAAYQCLTAALVVFLPSLLAGRLFLRVGLRDMGLGAGRWRLGLLLLLPPLGAVVASFFLFRALVWPALGGPLCKIYPLDPQAGSNLSSFLRWEAWYFLYYLGWEGAFRGVVQLGLGKRVGFVPAMLFQAALTTLLHAGHPPIEVLASLAAAPLLGWAAWCTGSIWYGLGLHFVVGAGVDFVCIGGGWG